METTRRSFVKALCWNLMGLLMMSLIGLIMTGSLALGGVMAAVNTGVGFVMYSSCGHADP